MNPADLERLVTLEMPFGKHKGTLIADLPEAHPKLSQETLGGQNPARNNQSRPQQSQRVSFAHSHSSR